MAPKKRKAEYESESEGDERVEEEEDDDDALFDEEEEAAPPPSKKKPKQLAVPAGGGKMAAVAMMRAQQQAADDDDDDDDGPVRNDDDDDDTDTDDSLSSALSPEEQAKLAQMTELEREMWLFERDDELTRRREMRDYKKRAKGKPAAAAKPSDRLLRRGAGGTDASSKRNALEQLAAARRTQAERKKQAAERRRESGGGAGGSEEGAAARRLSEGDEDEEEEGQRRPSSAKPQRRRGAAAAASESDEDDGNRSYSGAATESDDEQADDDEAAKAKRGDEGAVVAQEDDAEQATPDDVRAMQLSRRVLAAWVDHPLFVATVPGFVVRVAFGDRHDPALGRRVTRYLVARVAAVVDLPSKPPYRFGGDPPPRRGPDGRPLPAKASDVAALLALPITAAVLPAGSSAPVAETTRHLLLEEGGHQVVLPMTQVSDQPATDQEIERYMRQARSALVGAALDPALVMQAIAAATTTTAAGGGKKGGGRGGGSASAAPSKAALEALSKAPRVAAVKPQTADLILRVVPSSDNGGGGGAGGAVGTKLISGAAANDAGVPLPPFVNAPICPLVRRDRRLAEGRLRRALAYRLTSDDVKRMLEEKRKRGRLAANLAAERAKAAFALEAAESLLAECSERLRRRRAEIAAGRRAPAMGEEGEDEDDLARAEEEAREAVAKERERLAALDERAAAAGGADGGAEGGGGGAAGGRGPGDGGGSDMAAISARNKALNFKKALEGASNVPGAAAVGAGGGAGGGDGGAAGIPSSTDAFARRQTKSSVYWNTRGAAAKKAGGDDDGKKAGEDDATAAAKKKQAEAAAAAAALKKQREEEEQELLLLRTSSAALGDTAALDPRLAALDPARLLDALELGVDDEVLARALGKLGLPVGGGGAPASGGADAVLLPRRVLGPRWAGPRAAPLPQNARVLTFAEWRERWLLSQEKEAAAAAAAAAGGQQ